MERFATLLDRLSFMAARNGKIRLLMDYFGATPDPDRGLALAALTGELSFRHAKPAVIRDLATSRVDPALFELSYDYVGDLAETTALIWPANPATASPPRLHAVVDALAAAPKSDVPTLLERWLDDLDPTGRWALLKLITGGLRIGVSTRLAKTAAASFGGVTTAEIEELWHGLTPPYVDLFVWLDGRAGPPSVTDPLVFRPLMLANPLSDGDAETLDFGAYIAEWKWDGIRVQCAGAAGRARMFSRTGDDISAAFPDLLGMITFDAIVDGELLIVRDGEVAPFNDLQQRLNRKTVTAKMVQQYPAYLRLYDLLIEEGDDLRSLPFEARRRRLEAWFGRIKPARCDLSPLVTFSSLDDLHKLRQSSRARGLEGLMLKRRDSAYVAGRPKGPWFKWKRDPLTLDVVLMYAQRGHGKRSSYYSDYTFGTWRDGSSGQPELVPVGKAYSGYSDADLRRLDKWVRDHTVKRFGPVREVSPGLVLEVAFDAIHPSRRHKSGVAMRFPRIHRIRWDKPAEEADRLDTALSMIDD